MPKNEINQVNKGLNTNVTPVFQPNGSYPFALNSVLLSREGNQGSLINEEGNTLCVTFPEGVIPNGSVNIGDTKHIIFATDNTTSYVYLYNGLSCSLQVLINSDCLNFRTYHQIDAKYRILRGCEIMIYFTDIFNPYRSININDLNYYTNDGYNADTANADPANGWNCNKFKHFPSFKEPCIDLNKILDSGNLQVGTYQFVIRYLDKNLNPTNWSHVTNPIPVIDESESAQYSTRDGRISSADTFSKSILLDIEDLDVNFDYYQLAVLESVQGLGSVSNFYILNKIPISNITTSQYLYSGFDPTQHSLAVANDVLVPNLIMNTVVAHEQIDNRLLLANVTDYTEDWATLQRAFLRTNIEFTTKKINEFTEGSKSPYVYYDYRTFMRDEVYALGGVAVFENGLTSPVFHIPGRKKDIYNGSDITSLNASQAPENIHYRDNGVVNQWDSHLLTVVPDGAMTDPLNQIESSNVSHIPETEFVNCGVTTSCVVGQQVIDVQLTTLASSTQITILNSSTIPSNSSIKLRLSMWTGRVITGVRQDTLLYDNYINTTVGNVITVPASDYYNYTSFPILYKIELEVSSGNCSLNRTLSYDNIVPTNTTVNFSLGNRVSAGIGGGLYINDVDNNDIVFFESSYKATCQIERWKVYNTAVNLTKNTDGEVTGIFGYYEANQTYPKIEDCSGVSIWDATSVGGENLSDEFIRHYRFPDVALENHAVGIIDDANLENITKGTIYPIGLKVDLTNVISNIPLSTREKIVGFYIVKSRRDVFNSTVNDKVVVKACVDVIEGGSSKLSKTTPSGDFFNSIFSDFLVLSDRGEIISNKVNFDKKLSEGSYVKLEKRMQCHVVSPFQQRYFISENYDYNSINDIEMKTVLYYNYNSSSLPARTPYNQNASYHLQNRKILGTAIVPHNSIGSFVQKDVFNNQGKQLTGLGLFNKSISSSYPYGSLLSSEQFANLYSSNQGEFNGTIDSTGVGLSVYAIKTWIRPYSNLSGIVYDATDNCLIRTDTLTPANNIMFGGDTHITLAKFFKTRGKRYGTNEYVGIAAIANFFIESSVNSSLRDEREYKDRYAPKSFNSDTMLSFLGANRYDSDIQEPAIDDDAIEEWREFDYAYNKDFSNSNTALPYLPLDNTYDYCNSCKGAQPNTVYFSEKSNNEEVSDKYRIFKANNYTNIQSNTGQITNLFLEKDQIYAHTERGLWFLQTRPQQLTTNESTTYIGTGDFLSIPPKQIVTTDYGYAGSIDKFATIGTQKGTLFIDRNSRKVFMFSQSLDDISEIGMSQWFNENLTLKLDNQIKDLLRDIFALLGFNYIGVKHTVDKNSTGFQTTYDPELDRVIIHKRDYLIRRDVEFGGLPPFGGMLPNTLYINFSDEGFITFIYNGQEVDLNNKDLFENHCWTISFNLDDKAWVSWHSYQPQLMLNDNMKYYTGIYNSLSGAFSLWKHGVRNFGSYYGTGYEHIIELIVNPNPAQEKLYEMVQYQSDVTLYIGNGFDEYRMIENRTFTSFLVSNSYQISDKRDTYVKTNAYDDIFLPMNLSLVDKTDNYWRINRFRDICNHRFTLFTKEWLQRISYYDNDGQGYIDKVTNPLGLANDKTQYNQPRFRDKYLSLRLFFRTLNTEKIVTNLFAISNKPSLR